MLSIVIITRNEEDYLPRLLASIKTQIYPGELEIIVADHDSQDNTRTIAKKFSAKVVEGGLPSEGRNRGAKAASGNLLLFLDADMELPPHFLVKAVGEFRKRKLKSAAIGFKTRSGNFWEVFGTWFYYRFLIIAEYFSPVSGSCILVDRNLFNLVEGFDENVLFQEDNELIKRTSKLDKFGVLRNACVFVSMRRVREDGHLRFFLRSCCLEFYKLLHGKITKMPFNYDMRGINLKGLRYKPRL